MIIENDSTRHPRFALVGESGDAQLNPHLGNVVGVGQSHGGIAKPTGAVAGRQHMAFGGHRYDHVPELDHVPAGQDAQGKHRSRPVAVQQGVVMELLASCAHNRQYVRHNWAHRSKLATIWSHFLPSRPNGGRTNSRMSLEVARRVLASPSLAAYLCYVWRKMAVTPVPHSGCRVRSGNSLDFTTSPSTWRAVARAQASDHRNAAMDGYGREPVRDSLQARAKDDTGTADDDM